MRDPGHVRRQKQPPPLGPHPRRARASLRLLRRPHLQRGPCAHPHRDGARRGRRPGALPAPRHRGPKGETLPSPSLPLPSTVSWRVEMIVEDCVAARHCTSQPHSDLACPNCLPPNGASPAAVVLKNYLLGQPTGGGNAEEVDRSTALCPSDRGDSDGTETSSSSAFRRSSGASYGGTALVN